MARKRKVPEAAEFDVPRERLWRRLVDHADATNRGPGGINIADVQGDPATVRRGVTQRINFEGQGSTDPAKKRAGAVAGALLDLELAATERKTAAWYLRLRADTLDKATQALSAVGALRQSWRDLADRAKSDRPDIPPMVFYWPEQVARELAARDVALTAAAAFIEDYRIAIDNLGSQVWGADTAPDVLRKIDSVARHLANSGFNPQNWPAYNAAQTTEKERVELLLKSLCEGIEEPPPAKTGRPRIPLRDSIFSATMKVYTTFSGRRASTDIRGCAERGHIADAPHYNSIFRCMESAATTDILIRLIEESAAPLAEIENVAGQFAQDSTGFSTVTYDRWFDQKHGKLMAQHAWVKLHVMIGTVTNVVTGVKVSDEGDCPLLPELLKQTTKGFKVKEVSGDKAYLSIKNLEAIEDIGAVPFIPFKINSVGMSSTSPHWRRMWAHFSLKSGDFLSRYHRRSNVETTMWMIKSKFGGAVRSKLPTAQVNEVLAKVLCHNLTCIVHAITEFGIEADFAPKSAPSAPPVLSLVLP
jgi:transposase